MSHIKCVILGSSHVGKSSLIRQYVDKRFDLSSKATIGTDIATKTVSVGADGVVTLSICDTAGQERFRSLASSHYRSAEVCIIVFDITQPETFEQIDEWLQEFRRVVHVDAGERFPFFIVGNKTDLEDERVVPSADARRWCEQQGFRYLETSAKLADGVDQLFREAAVAAVHKRKQRDILDEGTAAMAGGVQRARLVPVGKQSAVQEQDKKSCGGMCGGGGGSGN